MDGQVDAGSAQFGTPPDPSPLPDFKLNADAITTARERADSLVADIEGHRDTIAIKVDGIEQMRLSAESAKGEINAQLAAMTEAVGVLNQQTEAARGTIVQANAVLESLRILASTATESVSRIEALKTQVEQSAQVASQRSEHIEDGRRYVDSKRAEIDVLLNTAQQSASSAEAQHLGSRTTSENLTMLYVASQKVKADTERDSKAVASLLVDCNQHATTTRALADKAETTAQRIADYETRLTQLEVTANNRLKTIESLLPGATSAGLASAFNQRRAHFKWPQRVWQAVFVVSLLALLVIAGLEFSLFSKVDGALTWDRLGLSLLHRLPFALPLIWLAIHSGHKAALAQRVEEDYAFKETVSRSFEGFRREMSELEGKTAPNSTLTRLCAGVLGVITNPPGRIYEKHPLNNTPLRALADSATPLTSVASNAAKGQAGL